MRKFAKEQEEAEINMTPMLDIVFIMLIFFIVTATFVRESGLDVNMPDSQSETPPDPDKQNIVIRITNNNRIFVGLRAVDIRSVRPNVERLYAENPEGIVVIQPAPDAHSGLIVEVYDQALQAGVSNVALAQGGGR